MSGESAISRWWARYATVDRRVLGVFRVVFASVLLYDVARRFPEASRLYSNDGLLSNHFLLWSPQATPQLSLLFPCSTPAEVRLGFALIAVVYLALLVGYRTRLAQIASFLAIASLNARNLWFEDGGVAVLINLGALTAFLPLGDRYSVDAVRRRWARLRRPAEDLPRARDEEDAAGAIASIAVVALTLEVALIYAMNAVQKTGVTWRSGEAVHLVLWQNRIATPLAVLLRSHEPGWLSPFLTRATIVLEASLPLLVLSPVRMRDFRTVAVVAGIGFHLSIAAVMTLGPFSYAMAALLLLLLPPDSLSAALRSVLPELPATTLRYDGAAMGQVLLARSLAALDGARRLELVEATGESLSASRDGVVLARGEEAVVRACDSLRGGGLLAALLRRPTLSRLVRATLAGCRGSPMNAPARAPRRALLAPLREATAGVLVLLLAMEATATNPVVPEVLRFPVPEALRPVIGYPRLLQSWSMFAPDAPTDDGTMVVDAVTADGRHLDPFTGTAPDFDLGRFAPVPHSAMLSDALFALHWDANERYRVELARYLRCWQAVTGRPASDQLVSFDVYWVSHMSPRRRGGASGVTRSPVLHGDVQR